MAKKNTYIYQVTLSNNRGNNTSTHWVYGRNAKSVERHFKENVYPVIKYDKIDVKLYGENPSVMSNPVVGFTAEETRMVEGYESYRRQQENLL